MEQKNKKTNIKQNKSGNIKEGNTTKGHKGSINKIQHTFSL